jgi:hypothetical protein
MCAMTRAARIVGGTAIVLLAVFNPWTRPVARAGSTAARAGDFDGDGSAELATYRPATGMWTIQGMAGAQLGQPGDIAVPADYDGDGNEDVAVWRPSTGDWHIAGQATRNWGPPSDGNYIPVPADYDGDGKDEPAIYVPYGRDCQSAFFVSSYPHPLPSFEPPLPCVSGSREEKYGGTRAQTSDIPVPADYNGDGKAEEAIFRPGAGVGPRATGFGVSGQWVVKDMTTVLWGEVGDIPVPADYNGDGTTEIAVYRSGLPESSWIIRGVGTRTLGRAGDLPVPQDVNGDGKAELVVYRPSTATWYSCDTGSGPVSVVAIGQLGDIPARLPGYYQIHRVAGDADGDRMRDFNIFRPSDGMWWTRFSSGDNSSWPTSTWQGVTWGIEGDIPVAGDYDGDGRMDPAIYRPSYGAWCARFSSGDNSSWETSTWQCWWVGQPGDIPVPGDYDGDGRTDPAIYRPYSTFVYFASTLGYAMRTIDILPGSAATERVLSGDFNGDGRDDVAMCSNQGRSWRITSRYPEWSKYYVTWPTIPFTAPTCLAADFDGDGSVDPVLYDQATGRWAWLTSASNYWLVGGGWYWGGGSDDEPAPGDYDGDGRADIAIYRPSDGMWWLLFSASGYTTWQGVLWGTLPGDIPVPHR